MFMGTYSRASLESKLRTSVALSFFSFTQSGERWAFFKMYERKESEGQEVKKSGSEVTAPEKSLRAQFPWLPGN